MNTTKTIISISIVLFALSSIYSCRQDEMDIVPNNESLVSAEKKNNVSSKSGDTLQASENLHNDQGGSEVADPPQKDKDQWRH